MQWWVGAGLSGDSGKEGKCGGYPKRIGRSWKVAHQGLTEVRHGKGWSLDFAIREVISVERYELTSIICGKWGSVNNLEHPATEKASFL